MDQRTGAVGVLEFVVFHLDERVGIPEQELLKRALDLHGRCIFKIGSGKRVMSEYRGTAARTPKPALRIELRVFI
jgi:hypothetical protein